MAFRLLFLLLYCGSLSATSWYDQKLEGWYYFQEQEEGEEKPSSIDEAEEILDTEKRTLKKLLSLALLIPTEENLEKYMVGQKRWVDQSARFAESWGKVLLQKPTLGDFLLNPTTNYGILAKREVDNAIQKELLQKLSKSYFLLFFFRGDDPLAEKAAEVANLFTSLHGWTLKAISLDGQGLKNVKSFEKDKGISLNLGVNGTPSFFIVNPFENKGFPVGAGLISVSDLEKNIATQIEYEDLDE